MTEVHTAALGRNPLGTFHALDVAHKYVENIPSPPRLSARAILWTRSFCFVNDEIDGLRLSKSGEHPPVNIGNPNESTILECAPTGLEGDRVEEPDSLRTASPG